DPGARRGDGERRSGIGGTDPKRDGPADRWAHEPRHRAPSLDHPDRRSNPRAAWGRRDRVGAPWRAARPWRSLRATVRPAVRGRRPMTRPRRLRAARFHRAVYRLVEQIPRGQVATYGQIAALLGWPRAARAVGYAMRHCPANVPWHRVVNARGGISVRANVG